MPDNIYHLDPESALGKAMTIENLAIVAEFQASEVLRISSELNVEIEGNSYVPEDDYVYIPIHDTDPWLTADHIKLKYTSGGEFFIKRGDASSPTNFAETYQGPYFTWIKEPEYNGNDSLQQTYGRLNDHVIGESYYGATGAGKPKGKGLLPNQLLEASTTFLRQELGGAIFVDIDDQKDPVLMPSTSSMTFVEIQVAKADGIHIDQVAEPSSTIPDVINVKSWGDKKYIHITQIINLTSGLDVLNGNDTNMTQLAPTEQRFGMKGRPPIITNQPNFKIDWDNQPL